MNKSDYIKALDAIQASENLKKKVSSVTAVKKPSSRMYAYLSAAACLCLIIAAVKLLPMFSMKSAEFNGISSKSDSALSDEAYHSSYPMCLGSYQSENEDSVTEINSPEELSMFLSQNPEASALIPSDYFSVDDFFYFNKSLLIIQISSDEYSPTFEGSEFDGNQTIIRFSAADDDSPKGFIHLFILEIDKTPFSVIKNNNKIS